MWGWTTFPMRTGWDCWGCSAWRREGSMKTWEEHFSNIKGDCKNGGDRLFSRIHCDSARGDGFKQKELRFTLDIMKKFFTIMVVKHCNRLLRNTMDVHVWRHSRSGWTELWATWSSSRCPCSLQGSWTRWPLKFPSNSNDSIILYNEKYGIFFVIPTLFLS